MIYTVTLNPVLSQRQVHDGAIMPIEGATLAFTTDSLVMGPLFFPIVSGPAVGRAVA